MNMELYVAFSTILLLPSVFCSANIHGESVAELISANTQFAVDLYREIAKQSGVTNIVFSPVSVAAALAMVKLGTAGNTTAEIDRALHLENIESSLVNSAFGELNGLLFDKSKDKITLKGANAAFVSKKASVLKSYRNALSVFGAEIQDLDFGDSAACVKHINKWISDNTGGFIKDMLDGDAINEAASLLLTSTLYFNGEWHSGFNPKHTEERGFYTSHYKIIKTPFMFQRGKFKYGYVKSLALQVLEMAYVGQEVSMIVLMPDNFDFDAIEENLNHANLTKWLSDLEYDTVDLTFPKFKIESGVELQGPLEELGVSNLFSSGLADLSGITGDKSLHVDKIFHKGVLEVTEEGSTAAAATTVNVLARSANFATRFLADHPFIWLIRDNKTGHVLFLGRYSRPEGVEMSHGEL